MGHAKRIAEGKVDLSNKNAIFCLIKARWNLLLIPILKFTHIKEMSLHI